MDTVDTYTVNLNDMHMDGSIECPYCQRGKTYSYGAKGKLSSACNVCKHIVLWDFDRMVAYRVRARKYAS